MAEKYCVEHQLTCAALEITKIVPFGSKAVLAIDMSVVDCSSKEAQKIIGSHLEEGGTVIFGIVDAKLREIGADSAAMRISLISELLSGIGSERAQVVLSGGCGTGLHRVSYEKALAHLLKDKAASLASSPFFRL